MERKEALEVVRKNMPTDRSLPVYEALQTLIPELAESEDERIRRRLINLIKELAANKEAIHTAGYFVDGQDKKYIAYLEKQKPAEWSEEDVDILNCCISSIEEAKENRYAYKETDGDTSYDREIAWLKSLQLKKL